MSNAGAEHKKHRLGTVSFPGLCFFAVVRSGVCRFPGDGVDAPHVATGGVLLSLLLFGELFIGNEFFHTVFLLWTFHEVYHPLSVSARGAY